MRSLRPRTPRRPATRLVRTLVPVERTVMPHPWWTLDHVPDAREHRAAGVARATRAGRATPVHRVLVVDDDPRVRAAVRALLDGTGDLTVVAAAATPDQARAALAATGADCALVDVRLPAGLDLIGELATRMPVVAFSVSGASRVPAVRAGAAAFVEKDGRADRLLEALRRTAAGDVHR